MKTESYVQYTDLLFQMAVCSDSSLITVVVPLWAAAEHHITVYILGRVLNGSGLHLHDTAETTNVCVRFFVVFMTMRIWIVILWELGEFNLV